MKKILAIVICIGLCGLITGCGNTDESSDNIGKSSGAITDPSDTKESSTSRTGETTAIADDTTPEPAQTSDTDISTDTDITDIESLSDKYIKDGVFTDPDDLISFNVSEDWELYNVSLSLAFRNISQPSVTMSYIVLEDDLDTFDSLTEEAFTSVYSTMFDDFKLESYENIKINDYDGIKIYVTGEISAVKQNMYVYYIKSDKYLCTATFISPAADYNFEDTFATVFDSFTMK